MLKTRQAFTMIELIFVIVIIGILASVAIPKLAATRDDAAAVTVVHNTKQVLVDLKSFYTAKGPKRYNSGNGSGSGAKIPDITSVVLYLNNTCTTRATVAQRKFAGATLYYCQNSDPVLQITSANTGSTVTFKHNTTGTLLSNMLSTYAAFQKLTNGVAGKDYDISVSTVSFD